ncbi:beta-1,3-galactosyltransferase brn [Aethina tumida]|uniref:beta-1,3-galactosyltransferase brn n=1 Tax=Aethina tumida TaxID=116153 RepID=UPI00096B41A7|nr:beta-1,3-galactosyltransferase brn [Aethina tumida]
MRVMRPKKLLFVTVIVTLTLLFFGVFTHLFEKDFDDNFRYPYEGDIEELVLQLKHNETPTIPAINHYNFRFYNLPSMQCELIHDLRLVYIIKSSPENFLNRKAIRSSWGFERRFSDVEIRRIFLLGWQKSKEVQQKIDTEAGEHNDIVQADFVDSYFNNTYKTMSGFTWAVNYCRNSKFYMFVDDDYYVSTKNVLRFLRYPTNYPQYLQHPLSNVNKILHIRKPLQVDLNLNDDVRLYTGYTFESSPLRHYMSKWYVSLEEYPYNKWPPYVTAGAYILSIQALLDMYYASFYTKHFRFDDIYVGILAYKTKIEPFHCPEFYFYKKNYEKYNYQYVIASHGYKDHIEMLTVWTEQKSLGFA